MSRQHSGRGPKNYKRWDQRIEEEMNDRLTAHPEIDASEIEAKVANGEVTLTGTVDERNAKRLTEDLAESIQGVSQVHNQLRVQSGQQSGGQGNRGGTQGSHGSQGSQGSASGSRKSAGSESQHEEPSHATSGRR
jgi:hypothetical protein